MNEKHIYTPEQKEEWFGKGEWCNEPDTVTFDHKGLKCLVFRVVKFEHDNHAFGGHFCGYVRVPKDNEIYGKSWSECPIDDIHGGLTFYEKQDDDLIIGFDCGHIVDILPCMRKFYENLDPENKFPNFPMLHPTYKNVEFVIYETKNLAEQVTKYDKRGSNDPLTK